MQSGGLPTRGIQIDPEVASTGQLVRLGSEAKESEEHSPPRVKLLAGGRRRTVGGKSLAEMGLL